jgi:nicotinamidase-related amidase
VIVAGTESHVCVLQTVLDLLASGFTVAVVEDAVGSRRPTDRRVALERMRQEGARITTVESLLYELTERAGTDVFRGILSIVK